MDLKTKRFHYKGNEYVTGNGLDMMDLISGNTTPQTGRFFSVDPLAALSTRWSSYSYGYNNPIRFIDVDGMYVDDYDYKSLEKKSYLYKQISCVGTIYHALYTLFHCCHIIL